MKKLHQILLATVRPLKWPSLFVAPLFIVVGIAAPIAAISKTIPTGEAILGIILAGAWFFIVGTVAFGYSIFIFVTKSSQDD